MRTLRKLSSFAAAAGVSAMLAVPVAPAYASVQGRDTLLGAGIGALAGGLLGHGKIGPVVGGAAPQTSRLLLRPLRPHTHQYVYYTGRRAYDRYGYYDPYGYYPRG